MRRRTAQAKGLASGRDHPVADRVNYTPLRSVVLEGRKVPWCLPDVHARQVCYRFCSDSLPLEAAEYTQQARVWADYKLRARRVVELMLPGQMKLAQAHINEHGGRIPTRDEVAERILSDFDEQHRPRGPDGNYLTEPVAPDFALKGPRLPEEVSDIWPGISSLTRHAAQNQMRLTGCVVTRNALTGRLQEKMLRLKLGKLGVILYPKGHGDKYPGSHVPAMACYASREARDVANILTTILGVPFCEAIDTSGRKGFTLTPKGYSDAIPEDVHDAALHIWHRYVLEVHDTATVRDLVRQEPRTGTPPAQAGPRNSRAVQARRPPRTAESRATPAAGVVDPDSTEGQVLALIKASRRRNSGVSKPLSPTDHAHAAVLTEAVNEGVVALSRLDRCATVAEMLRIADDGWDSHQFGYLLRPATGSSVGTPGSASREDHRVASAAGSSSGRASASLGAASCDEGATAYDAAAVAQTIAGRANCPLTSGFRSFAEAAPGVPGAADQLVTELEEVAWTLGALGLDTPDTVAVVQPFLDRVATVSSADKWRQAAAGLQRFSAYISEALDNREKREEQRRLLAAQMAAEGRDAQDALRNQRRASGSAESHTTESEMSLLSLMDSETPLSAQNELIIKLVLEHRLRPIVWRGPSEDERGPYMEFYDPARDTVIWKGAVAADGHDCVADYVRFMTSTNVDTPRYLLMHRIDEWAELSATRRIGRAGLEGAVSTGSRDTTIVSSHSASDAASVVVETTVSRMAEAAQPTTTADEF